MNIVWKSPSQHKAAMDAKDAEIAELEKKLSSGTESDASKTLANVTALFGVAANEKDFDLKAVVQSVIASNETAETALADTTAKLQTTQGSLTKAEGELATAKTSLETANANLTTADTAMTTVAGLLGIERAEGTDMVAEVGKLEFAKREAPLEDPKNPKEAPKAEEDTETEFDLELAAAIKKING